MSYNRSRKGDVELTPLYLIGMGALMVGHGVWQWLTSPDRAEDHRRSIDSGEERFLEHAPRPASVVGVEWWAKAEILVGLGMIAWGAVNYAAEGRA